MNIVMNDGGGFIEVQGTAEGHAFRRSELDRLLELGEKGKQTTRFDAAGCILVAAEKATWMAGETIQVLGGNGYINEFPAGRFWRDAKLYEIGAGTSEIRRMLIGRELFNATT